MANIKFFLRPYYIANTSVLLLYLLIRLLGNKPRKADLKDETLPEAIAYNREIQILATASVVIFARYIKSPTWESFFSQFFTYMKVSCFISCYYISYITMAWYAIANLVVWMLFKMPLYEGPHKFQSFSSFSDFENTVLKGGTWVVLFYAEWNETCVTTMSMWADLSLKYSTKELKFGRVDVEKLEYLAKKCAVDTSSMSNQLPSLVLYEKGREVKRFPPVSEDGRIPKVLNYRAKDIVNYLGIERIYLVTRN